MAFGRAVAHHRKRAGLTQAQLAERSSFHPSVVGFIEQGIREVGVGKVGPIARALGVAPGDLFIPLEESETEER